VFLFVHGRHFVVFSWLRFNTNGSNLLIIYQHLVLCSKIALVLMSPIADGMLQCRNRKAISESILPFILETSYRIIKGRNSKSYLQTIEKSTEKNHQNFDDCGIQSLTVMTDFITEHSSTQETNTMDEHEMQSLCIRYEVSKIKGRIDSEIAFLFRHCNIPSAIGLIKTSAILEHTTKC
jgi:hypothetical protein